MLSFLSLCLPEANAWFWDKKGGEKEKAVETKEEQPSVEPVKSKAGEQSKAGEKKETEELQKKTDKVEEGAIKARKAKTQQKLAEMDNTEWQIELSPLSGKGKKEAETVYFKDNKVSFAVYGKKGFPATNFTLTVQEDGMVIWETMQTSEKNGIAFWRGELDQNLQSMRGVLSHQIDQKTKQDYFFASTGKKNIPRSGN
jgi:hypothetical protein